VRLLSVDPVGLAQVAAQVRALAGRLDASAVEVGAISRQLSGPVGLELPGVARAMAEVMARVMALARVIALVADSFARTEARVEGAMWSLLAGLRPAGLEALLVGCPALSRLLVQEPPGSIGGAPAARLEALLTSGEPPTVILRAARDLVLTLPAAARRMLSLLQPGLVSGLASAPVAERVVATRVLVAAAAAGAVGRRSAWYGELLHGTVTLTRPDGSRLVRPHQLLAFDPRGDGRVVEVFGDLRVARHLAVYVPGTGTSLDRYAGNAVRASQFAAAQPDLAVVLWQNADFPDQPLDHVVPPVSMWDRPVEAVQHQLRAHVFAAAYRDAADQAGPVLAHDLEGLRMAEPVAGADVTLLGHSYGGSVVGSAEAHGLVVDRVVHISSAGGYVTDVDQYAAGECGTHRFSMTDPDDPIQLAQGVGLGSAGQAAHALHDVAAVLPGPLKPLAGPVVGGLAVVSGGPTHLGHGLDPDQIPSVTRLDTGVGADGRLVSGHGGMFDPGSTAWRNLLAVMHGDPVSVLEPDRWQTHLVPADVSVSVSVSVGAGGMHATYTNPHYVVTRSPYDAVGYQPPVQPSTTPTCARPPSW
jgi:Alpha/beta hydrolase